ncbi:hypothetical protein EVAR_67857_1 [Eumeta japonica]|uniref:Uncharacterized protein n=1 Tax=Eumeta variegata TaxID=151549 RepID=A0A4C1STT3_EUMVA|nr:hypothetical protein EVAR_67857_1 [Eumeta japonica]
MDELYVKCLLYADDQVILATSACGLKMWTDPFLTKNQEVAIHKSGPLKMTLELCEMNECSGAYSIYVVYRYQSDIDRLLGTDRLADKHLRVEYKKKNCENTESYIKNRAIHRAIYIYCYCGRAMSLWFVQLQHKIGQARPVKYHFLTKYGCKEIVSAVEFRSLSESSGGLLLLFPSPSALLPLPSPRSSPLYLRFSPKRTSMANSLGLQLSMGGGHHLPSDASPSRLPLCYKKADQNLFATKTFGNIGSQALYFYRHIVFRDITSTT